MLFGLVNLPLCVIGAVYLNSLEIGWTSCCEGSCSTFRNPMT